MPEEVAAAPPVVVVVSEPWPMQPVHPVQLVIPPPVATATVAMADTNSITSVETVGAADEDDDDDEAEDGEDGQDRPKNSKLGVCKKAWTPAEDKVLQEVVEKNGAHRWSTVAGHLPGRMGKQCRERCAHSR